ncbi:MAG: RrF2 family transcriptional regulator [Anaerolineae bacterium]|nr:RrF2 family transcriptional regulator [Anaerolineae bacterium]
MRLSTLGRYALRAMVDLAAHQGQGPILRRDIARRQEISSPYLAQLLGKLRHAGLVESVPGPGGGYTLARRPSEISAGDVLRAVGESLSVVHCVDAAPDETCPRADVCATHPLWVRLSQAIHTALDATTLDQLYTEADQGRRARREHAAEPGSRTHVEEPA